MKVAERKFLRWCRTDRGRVAGSFKYLNSKILYDDANVRRIDAWLISLYLKTFEKFATSDNELVRRMFSPESMARSERLEKYPAPERLHHENQRTPLLDQLGRVF